MSPDVRMLTGPCQMVIGGVLLFIAARLWQSNTGRRVVRLARFVSPEGLKAILEHRPVFLAFGLFIVTQGLTNMTFWLLAARDVNNPFVAALGAMGVVFGVWAAWLAGRLTVRIWRNR